MKDRHSRVAAHLGEARESATPVRFGRGSPISASASAAGALSASDERNPATRVNDRRGNQRDAVGGSTARSDAERGRIAAAPCHVSLMEQLKEDKIQQFALRHHNGRRESPAGATVSLKNDV